MIEQVEKTNQFLKELGGVINNALQAGNTSPEEPVAWTMLVFHASNINRASINHVGNIPLGCQLEAARAYVSLLEDRIAHTVPGTDSLQ